MECYYIFPSSRYTDEVPTSEYVNDKALKNLSHSAKATIFYLSAWMNLIIIKTGNLDILSN